MLVHGLSCLLSGWIFQPVGPPSKAGMAQPNMAWSGRKILVQMRHLLQRCLPQSPYVVLHHLGHLLSQSCFNLFHYTHLEIELFGFTAWTDDRDKSMALGWRKHQSLSVWWGNMLAVKVARSMPQCMPQPWWHDLEASQVDASPTSMPTFCTCIRWQNKSLQTINAVLALFYHIDYYAIMNNSGIE
jgi:hypothetical protein